MFMLKYFYLSSLILTALSFDAGFLEVRPEARASSDTTHYRITVCALCRVTADYLKSVYKVDISVFERKFNQTDGNCASTIVNDMVQLIRNPKTAGLNSLDFSSMVKRIASTNTKTDLKEMFTEESHFDSESFRGGSELVLKRYLGAVNSIVRLDNADQARKTFGEMLHTLQDFYSHSNYVELGYKEPNADLARRIIQPSQYAPKDMRTCVSCKGSDCESQPNLDQAILKKKLLTSGYFIPIGVSLFTKSKPPGKCSHGGAPDSSSRDEPTGGINKDTLSSPHQSLHYQAAFMAYKASVQVLQQFRNEIGDEMFGLFLTLKKNLNSLVIIIDTECSKSDYINLAQQISRRIVNDYQSLEYAPHNYILITIGSDQSKLIVRSRDATALRNGIGNLTSCSPMTTDIGNFYYQSLVTALKYCEYTSVIYTFTDSPARDAYLKDQSRALLKTKDVVIYSFLGTELKKAESRIQRDVIDPLDGKGNDIDLASISGGLTLPITNTDDSTISQFILQRLDWTRIKTIAIFKPIGGSIRFYVDPSFEELYIDVTSTDYLQNLDRFRLIGANGRSYQLTNSSQKTRYLNTWTMKDPPAGIWQFNVTNASNLANYKVQIQARTSVGCTSSLQKQMEQNADSSGVTDLTNEPLINSTILISSSCDLTGISSFNTTLLDEYGRIIASYTGRADESSSSSTEIRVPKEKFRIETIVRLSNGTFYQRIGKKLIVPSIFSIELLNQPYVLDRGETVQMNYTIRSALKNPANIRLQIFDTLNMLGKTSIERNMTFINETSGFYSISLSNNTKETTIINSVTFALSTFDQQVGRFIYQNDETVSVYLELSAAMNLTGFPLLIYFLLCFSQSIF